MRITILGLSITSSWGNGHATTYRGLVRALARRGHCVVFLERNVPWYAANRDLPEPPFCRTRLYESLEELHDRHAATIRDSEAVIVGSYVPDGAAIGRWIHSQAQGVTAFYDIDTPVTLTQLRQQRCDYLSPELVGRYDCYLSFTGGPVLRRLEDEYGSPGARPLYCSVDPDLYHPGEQRPQFDLGYLGTYSDDRQPPLKRMMLEAARRWPEGRFIVAGPQYPEAIDWPENVQRLEHLSPPEHCGFYGSQRFTMNITRADMVRTGYAPSVRLFEAAACGVPVISDWWRGLDEFFRPGREIFISGSADETLEALRNVDESRRREVAAAAREVVLREHTADRRAEQLEGYLVEAASRNRKRRTDPFPAGPAGTPGGHAVTAPTTDP